MNCVYLNVSSALLVLTASIFLLFEEGSWFSSVVEPAGSDGAPLPAVAGDRSIGVVALLLSLPEEPLVQSDTPLLTCNNRPKSVELRYKHGYRSDSLNRTQKIIDWDTTFLDFLRTESNQ